MKQFSLIFSTLLIVFSFQQVISAPVMMENASASKRPPKKREQWPDAEKWLMVGYDALTCEPRLFAVKAKSTNDYWRDPSKMQTSTKYLRVSSTQDIKTFISNEFDVDVDTKIGVLTSAKASFFNKLLTETQFSSEKITIIAFKKFFSYRVSVTTARLLPEADELLTQSQNEGNPYLFARKYGDVYANEAQLGGLIVITYEYIKTSQCTKTMKEIQAGAELKSKWITGAKLTDKEQATMEKNLENVVTIGSTQMTGAIPDAGFIDSPDKFKEVEKAFNDYYKDINNLSIIWSKFEPYGIKAAPGDRGLRNYQDRGRYLESLDKCQFVAEKYIQIIDNSSVLIDYPPYPEPVPFPLKWYWETGINTENLPDECQNINDNLASTKTYYETCAYALDKESGYFFTAREWLYTAPNNELMDPEQNRTWINIYYNIPDFHNNTLLWCPRIVSTEL